MKKVFIMVIALVGLIPPMLAQIPVTDREAVLVAQNKIRNMYGCSDTSVSGINTMFTQNEVVALYEVMLRCGYSVLLSGNRSCIPVLGIYKNDGGISIIRDLDAMPRGLQIIIHDYVRMVEECFFQRNISAYSNQWDSLIQGITSNNILRNSSELISSRWGESVSNDGVVEDTYNYYFPNVNNCKALTGTAAVAMGQLLYYWQYPFFITKKSVMLNWCNMTDEINSDDPCFSSERDAISRLLRECGDAACTDYGCNYSETSMSGVVNALRNYFHFHSESQFIRPPDAPLPGDPIAMELYRSFWITIKRDIDRGQPVLCYLDDFEGYDGYAICDGYNGDFDFHFNWGMTDGLFSVFASTNLYFLREIYPATECHVDSVVYLDEFYTDCWSSSLGIHPSRFVPGMADKLYSASNNSISTWRTIPTDTIAIYQAKLEIKLEDGFEAEYGSDFTAEIVKCCDNGNLRGENVNYQSTTFRNEMTYVLDKNLENDASDLFPNPTDGPLTMATDGMAEAVFIHDLAGRPVGGWHLDALTETFVTLDVSALRPGTYLLTVVIPSGTVTKKLLVQ